MKTNTAVVWGCVVVIAVAGIAFYAVHSANPPQTVVIQSSPSTSAGTGEAAVPQASAPAAVTNPNASPTDTTAIVTGSVVPNGAFTDYWYEYGVTPSLGYTTSDQSVGSGYAAIGAPYYITGLTKDTTYYFRLDAKNDLGGVTGTEYSFQTTEGNPPPVGSVPAVETLAANGIARTGATLNGRVTSNQAATTYWFEYGTTASLGDTSALVGIAGTSVGASASLPLTDLDPATTYYFRLDAQNQFGTVNGSILTFETSGPPAPTEPSVTTRSAVSIGLSTATLRGTVDPNGATTAYSFEYSTDPQFGSASLQTTDSTTLSAGGDPVSVSMTLSGLATSTLYYFRAVAENSLGTVHGDPLSFRTK